MYVTVLRLQRSLKFHWLPVQVQLYGLNLIALMGKSLHCARTAKCMHDG